MGKIVIVIGIMVVAAAACDNGTYDSGPIRKTAALAAGQQDWRHLLVKVAPSAACTLSSDFDPSQSIRFDADGHGLIGFDYGPMSSIARSDPLRLDCLGDNGATTSQELDMLTISSSQDALQALSAQPLPDDVIRPALEGDPQSYSQQYLIAHHYARRPDADKAPAAYSEWLEMVSKPLTLRSPRLVPYPEHRTLGGSSGTIWGGAVLENPSTVYAYVYGLWNVPSEPLFLQTYAAQSALWIGLDGRVGLGADDLIQTGTDTDTVRMPTIHGWVSVRSYYAWVEWWPYPLQRVTGLPVTGGDSFEAEAWIGDQYDNLDPSSSTAWYTVYNHTTSIGVETSQPKPSGYSFHGTTAEWIMERPPNYPLANFQTASVTQHGAYSSTWDFHDLTTDPGELMTLISTTTPSHTLATAVVDSSNYLDFAFVAAQ